MALAAVEPVFLLARHGLFFSCDIDVSFVCFQRWALAFIGVWASPRQQGLGHSLLYRVVCPVCDA